MSSVTLGTTTLIALSENLNISNILYAWQYKLMCHSMYHFIIRLDVFFKCT